MISNSTTNFNERKQCNKYKSCETKNQKTGLTYRSGNSVSTNFTKQERQNNAIRHSLGGITRFGNQPFSFSTTSQQPSYFSSIQSQAQSQTQSQTQSQSLSTLFRPYPFYQNDYQLESDTFQPHYFIVPDLSFPTTNTISFTNPNPHPNPNGSITFLGRTVGQPGGIIGPPRNSF